eukprot:m.455657 g.455657  ORF g.455657 m.455657 type:complete len:126 (-) comp21573_c0_seq20:2191-2568(-)
MHSHARRHADKHMLCALHEAKTQRHTCIIINIKGSGDTGEYCELCEAAGRKLVMVGTRDAVDHIYFSSGQRALDRGTFVPAVVGKERNTHVCFRNRKNQTKGTGFESCKNLPENRRANAIQRRSV